jgi:hypothetical protein
VLGVHAHPPDEALEAELPFEVLPALNTDSCKVWRLLAHLGHSISCFEDITMRS